MSVRLPRRFGVPNIGMLGGGEVDMLSSTTKS